jgi:CDP-paratose synthetase
MNKTILLTGATGFLGSHLLEALVESQYRVVILKRSFSDTWRIRHLLHKVTSYDLDKQPMDLAFKDQKINVVIHTATHYGRNNDPVSKIVETNTLFPLQLLETASLFKTDTFFNTDTLLYKYLNNYALSKKHFTEWLKLFSEDSRIKGINLKIEHMYGPRDDSKKFVPWLVQQMRDNAKSIPLTKGEQKRDFIYITDVVSAYMLLLEKKLTDQFSEFEVGTGKAVQVKNFVLELKNAMKMIQGLDIQPRLDFGALPYRQGEFMEIKADIDRLSALGWKPKYEIPQGIEKMLREQSV